MLRTKAQIRKLKRDTPLYRKRNIPFSYSRLDRDFTAGLDKMKLNDRSNLLERKGQKWTHNRKQRAHYDEKGEYQKCVNVLNWKDTLRQFIEGQYKKPRR